MINLSVNPGYFSFHVSLMIFIHLFWIKFYQVHILTPFSRGVIGETIQKFVSANTGLDLDKDLRLNQKLIN